MLRALSADAATRELGRLEAFSDGVFAIAVTLLILDVKVPHVQGATPLQLLHALAALWPSVLTFISSFVTITIIWLGHHNLLGRAQLVSPRILFANSVLLLLVTFIPFPTALLSEYLQTPAASVVCAGYALVAVLAGLAFTLLARALFLDGYLPGFAPDASVHRHHLRKNLIILGVYLLAAGVAFVSPWLSLVLLLATWVYWGLHL